MRYTFAWILSLFPWGSKTMYRKATRDDIILGVALVLVYPKNVSQYSSRHLTMEKVAIVGINVQRMHLTMQRPDGAVIGHEIDLFLNPAFNGGIIVLVY